MMLKNVSEKSVSVRLPNRLFKTLQPGEEYDFPNEDKYKAVEGLVLAGLELVKKSKKDEVAKKVKDYKEDLEDDGKRNYSNDPKKKRPGRKSKKSSKK